ncbi:ATP-binding protein [Rhodoferax sp. AJA081-3]|uniref:ATP-binding protein n=1 Tax=Rhodoferax sp. AJA081-3 TaxID=2752316 RepID=UPI001ADF7F1A|nr:ATP-binding protein [Rhodoferax sp. AJA081-3]QTN26860.1 ATP-binding protein [Rhodoferax sp. AJA081-3]
MARATEACERKLARQAKVPLLKGKDLGLNPLRATFYEDLQDLISARYERTATVLTINLDFEECKKSFAVNRLLGSANWIG